MANPLTTKWAPLESEIAHWMRARASKGLQFCAGRQAIPGFPTSGFRADELLTDGKTLLAVEVEVRQTHPDTNVGKYWLLGKHKRYDKTCLLHVYTPAYNSYGWRLELGRFYAEKMNSDFAFEYHLLDHRKSRSYKSTLDSVLSLLESKRVSLFESSVATKQELAEDQILSAVLTRGDLDVGVFG